MVRSAPVFRNTQIHLVGQERLSEYPLWRRQNGVGRRNGIISDSTIRIETGIFAAIMNFAVSKRCVPASQCFEGMPKLKTNRRDEATLEEYRELHSVGRKWMKEATTTQSSWYRTMCYNFIVIMCNTGMRPPEAKNLHWRDITKAKDRNGRDILVIYVQGKGNTRQLIAQTSVDGCVERVRVMSKPTLPDDPVFTIINGKPAKWLYRNNVEKLLTFASLRAGPSGIPRTTYCLRHTYATLPLSAGGAVYALTQQIGTSVKLTEQNYRHVNTIKHADRVLIDIGGWDAMHVEMDAEIDALEANAKAVQSIKTKQPLNPRQTKR